MDWLQDMAARWLRIMTAAGGGNTPLEEATRQISAIGEVREKKGRLKRHPAAAAEASTATVLSRQLIAGTPRWALASKGCSGSLRSRLQQ